MSVNLEVKGMLAKCLAMENIIIEHRKVPTAMFDVDRRVLTLPMWNKASDTVYTLLVAHEVGHSLATPNIDWTIDYPEVPKDFVNIVEDVRVERLMKKKYPGLAKTFYSGYNELNSDDFFSTKDENLDKLSFIDRINMYFKIGAFHNIAFSDQENEFLTRISKVETFQEVLEVCRDLVKFLKYERKQLNEMPEISQDQSQNGGGEEVDLPENFQQPSQDFMDLEQESQESSSTGEESQGEEIKMSNEAPSSGFGNEVSDEHGENFELESKTSKSFDEKSQDLNDKFAQETAYVEVPEINLETVIIPNKFIHDKSKEYYSSFQTWFDQVSTEYVTYKKSAEKEVSYLVKEFECKKSADQYARATTARTGVLDTSKLHTYKFNEDLFKKVSVIPDGKNHGLIFILDWSGSMADWMLDTCKQLFNLIWFCRKVNIPFEVYAFTLDCKAYVELQPDHPPIFKKVAGVLAPEQAFRLMNIFTHKTNAAELDQQMKHIWASCYAFQKGSGYYPSNLELSGSPIGDTMLALNALIPQFQRNNKLQKVNVVFLTDGEGYVNTSTVDKNRMDGESYVGFRKFYSTTLRDRKTGRVYESFDYGNFPVYSKVLLTSLKDRFPTVNLINFRITPARDFRTCHSWYGKNYNYDTAKAILKKNHFITFYGTGFDQFHVLPSTSLSQDEQFVVPEDASKAQIKTAFVKMLGKKKTNKKLLSSFVDVIA